MKGLKTEPNKSRTILYFTFYIHSLYMKVSYILILSRSLIFLWGDKTMYLNIWQKYLSIFSVARKSDILYQQNFCMSMCIHLPLVEPCNLQWTTIFLPQQMFLCSPEHFTFLSYKVCSSQWWYGESQWQPYQLVKNKYESFIKQITGIVRKGLGPNLKSFFNWLFKLL